MVAQLFTSLPPTWLISSLAAAALAVLCFARLRWLALALLACLWSLWNFQVRLEDRLAPELAGQILSVTGTIASLPSVFDEFARFRFDVSPSEGAARLPESLLVYWYQDWPALSAGQRWQLELRLKPPWASVNFQGADRERWYFAQGIGGIGIVRQGVMLRDSDSITSVVQRTREVIRHKVESLVSDERHRGIILALATADRSGMSHSDFRLLTLTGTSHLLAISGLHIGLAAAAGLWLGRIAIWLLPVAGLGRGPLLISLGGGFACAFVYAALAGLGISTLRALLMLLVLMAAIASSRSIHALRAWVMALAGTLLIDPFAPLGAGFWFSFLAVAALMAAFVPRTGILPWWKNLLMAQAAVMLVLLPVSAAWYGAFSAIGFIANLIAIPWISFLVVPFVLAGVATVGISSGLAAGVWAIAGHAAGLLMICLEWLAGLQGELIPVDNGNLPLACLAIAGSFLLLAPRRFPLRVYGYFLLSPLVLPKNNPIEQGELEMDILDVGQGTAIIVSTTRHSLLYDSGPGDGAEFNRVADTIVPALRRQHGSGPDRVIISHADLDHAGGLRALLDRYPRARYLVNHPDSSGRNGCHIPMNWTWDGWAFRVIHPSQALPYYGNDSSCVISIQSGRTGVLLSGDISETVENRLVLDGLTQHRVLLVPHHASNTSSSGTFIGQAAPFYAIATASLGNRFGFPRKEVLERYDAAGVTFWWTGECGAIRLQLSPSGGVQVSSARRTEKRIWRWPAGRHCP